MEFLAPRNFGPPLHLHEAEDELFYILDGELWLSAQFDIQVLGPPPAPIG